MKVSDFCSMVTDKSTGIVIFDLNPDVNEEVVYESSLEEFTDPRWDEFEVVSFEVNAWWNYYIPYIRLNIDTSN